MKKKIIILTAFMGLLLSACSDFLDRKPLTQPEDKGFLVGREQLENYINGLYSALPTPTQFGMSVRGEEVNSDNILAEKYDKRLNGENNQFSGATDWEKGYQNLRNVNYFFYHYEVPENLETDEVLSLREKLISYVHIGTSICLPALEIYLLWMIFGMETRHWKVCRFRLRNVRMLPGLY